MRAKSRRNAGACADTSPGRGRVWTRPQLRCRRRTDSTGAALERDGVRDRPIRGAAELLSAFFVDPGTRFAARALARRRFGAWTAAGSGRLLRDAGVAHRAPWRESGARWDKLERKRRAGRARRGDGAGSGARRARRSETPNRRSRVREVAEPRDPERADTIARPDGRRRPANCGRRRGRAERSCSGRSTGQPRARHCVAVAGRRGSLNSARRGLGCEPPSFATARCRP